MTESVADLFFKNLYEGFKLSSYRVDSDGCYELSLEPTTWGVCRKCGSQCDRVHDTVIRTVKDASAFGKNVVIKVPVRRLKCDHCGECHTEQIKWLYNDTYCHATERLAKTVIKDLENQSVKEVSRRTGLHWESVKTIHKRHLQNYYAGFSLQDARILAVDEFSISKGHRYATVVIDLETRRVIWIGKDRTKSTLNQFFKLCGTEGCKQIQAVAMDQNAAFDESVKDHCPNALVVYDMFHVLAKFGREVVSAIRLRLAGQYKGVDTQTYTKLKKSRWVLLRKNQNLTPKQKTRLDEILEANKDLYVVYVLKESLSGLWFCKTMEEGLAKWKEWKNMAISSGIPELIKFTELQDKKYLTGILNSSIFHIGTSVLEGINNRIKVIKRTAYGFRDFTYFFLKVKSVFPGIPR